ncbi:hypothetical protein Vafri_9332, partial [Volvox africanus]
MKPRYQHETPHRRSSLPWLHWGTKSLPTHLRVRYPGCKPHKYDAQVTVSTWAPTQRQVASCAGPLLPTPAPPPWSIAIAASISSTLPRDDAFVLDASTVADVGVAVGSPPPRLVPRPCR